MSVDVLREVLNHSQARGTDRNVLVALADSANPCGISWLSILPQKFQGSDASKCITHRANCSKREAVRAVQELERLGEIEVRKAQRGQRRVSVYAIRVGTYAEAEISYDDLPFDVDEPFVVRGANLAPRTDRPDDESGTSRGDGSGTPRGANLAPRGVPPSRALKDKRNPSFDPSFDPAADPSGPLPSAVVQFERPAPIELAAASDASETDPVSLERAVAMLARLNGWDSGSLRVVQPLLQGLPEKRFEETLAKTVARRASNPPGLLVHLLRTAIDDWRKAQSEARLATWDAFFGEVGLERVMHEDPDRYVLAWATPALDEARPLPWGLVLEHVVGYVFGHTDDPAERSRLLEVFVAAAERIPAFVSLRDGILKLIDRDGAPLADVEAAVTTLTEGHPDAKDELLAFAREIHGNIERERLRSAA